MNINGINIDIMGNDQSTNFAQTMLQTCIAHPECKDCPYVGRPVPSDDSNSVTICENGINKKKEST